MEHVLTWVIGWPLFVLARIQKWSRPIRSIGNGFFAPLFFLPIYLANFTNEHLPELPMLLKGFGVVALIFIQVSLFFSCFIASVFLLSDLDSRNGGVLFHVRNSLDRFLARALSALVGGDRE